MSDDTDTTTTEQTFTRAQVRSMIAAEVRKVSERFADYDDLKTAAAEAGKNKTAIERIEAKLDEQTKRAEKAERETLIRDVADELGVSVKIARKFEGKNREEMLADGRETLTDMGIEPDKSKRKNKSTDKQGTDAEGEGAEQDGDEHDEDDKPGDTDRQASGTTRNDEGDQQQRQPRRARPRETLRSGAPAGNSDRSESLSPLDLIKDVRRA